VKAPAILDAESPEITAFLAAWHENGRDLFKRSYPNLDYDQYDPKHATTRRTFVACDHGTSGAFLVDRLTHNVFSIKAYGVKGYFCGTVESLTMRYEEATKVHRAFRSARATAQAVRP
jgi:hypothetical protein